MELQINVDDDSIENCSKILRSVYSKYCNKFTNKFNIIGVSSLLYSCCFEQEDWISIRIIKNYITILKTNKYDCNNKFFYNFLMDIENSSDVNNTYYIEKYTGRKTR